MYIIFNTYYDYCILYTYYYIIMSLNSRKVKTLFSVELRTAFTPLYIHLILSFSFRYYPFKILKNNIHMFVTTSI